MAFRTLLLTTVFQDESMDTRWYELLLLAGLFNQSLNQALATRWEILARVRLITFMPNLFKKLPVNKNSWNTNIDKKSQMKQKGAVTQMLKIY